MASEIGEFHSVEYLGDSVYLGLDDIGRTWLFLFNGEVPHNEICLEADTMENLIIACRKFGFKHLINSQ